MKLTKTTAGIRVTDFSWLWGFIGFPLAMYFIFAFVTHVPRKDRPAELFWIAFGGILSGSTAILLTQWVDFRFDAHARKLVWKRRSLVRSLGGELDFDQIRFAVVQYNGWSKPNGGKGNWYRVALSTHSKPIPLTADYTLGQSSDDQCRHLRSEINELLGVSLDSEDDNDILELYRSGEHLWAERLAQARYGLSIWDARQYVGRLDNSDKQDEAA